MEDLIWGERREASLSRTEDFTPQRESMDGVNWAALVGLGLIVIVGLGFWLGIGLLVFHLLEVIF